MKTAAGCPTRSPSGTNHHRFVTDPTVTDIPARWVSRPLPRLRCSDTGVRADEEAQVGWVWTAVVVWVLLAVPGAVVLGRTIDRADQRELGKPERPRRSCRP
jgi:hypothetical protein